MPMSPSVPDRRLVVTCEHASKAAPFEYTHLFRGRETLLESHRVYDAGAWAFAEAFAAAFDAPVFSAPFTRLLADCNRSSRSRTLFSEISSPLDADVKRAILERCYRPFRTTVEDAIARFMAEGSSVLHLSVHSFTPVLDGVVRRCDIGLLYDPSRPSEASFCAAWRGGLAALLPGFRVRMNCPYRGTADGFTSLMRKRYGDPRYIGIELELNQGLLMEGGTFPGNVTAACVSGCRIALDA